MTVQVFVSYRRGDSPHAAGRLVDQMNAHFKLYIDVDTQPGVDFTVALREALNHTDVLIAVIGSQWLTSTAENGGRRIDQQGDWVAEEIGTALGRGTPVIPVLIDGADMPSRHELPPTLAALADRQALRITHDSFGTDSARLIQAIENTVNQARDPDRTAGQHPKTPRPSSQFQRWLGRSALVTGGLVLASGISESIETNDPATLVISLIVALPFLVGWLLLRARPRIGAAVTGIYAAAWSIFAVAASVEAGIDATPSQFALLSLLSALAAVVLSILVIRSR